MNRTPVIFEQSFDEALLDQISTLRTLRLNMAETMLRNLSLTSQELTARGLVDQVDQAELRQELMERIKIVRERLQDPQRIFADEIEFYDELAGDDELFELTAE